MRYLKIIVAVSLAMLLRVTPSPAQTGKTLLRPPPLSANWAPAELTITPEIAAPGSVVKITGGSFGQGLKVYLGHTRMDIVEARPDYVLAVVPLNVKDDFIYAVDRQRRARSFVAFGVSREYWPKGWDEPKW